MFLSVSKIGGLGKGGKVWAGTMPAVSGCELAMHSDAQRSHLRAEDVPMMQTVADLKGELKLCSFRYNSSTYLC